MEIITIVREEFNKRMIEEGLTRIIKCVEILDEKDLWYKHNESSNSVGNLILHLSGNVRQYVVSGIAGQKDSRERDSEFNIESKIGKEELIENLKQALYEANGIVAGLKEEELKASKEVQGFGLTVLSILIHVIEHFSYHVGQITYFTKYFKDTDTAYYAGLDLNKKSN